MGESRLGLIEGFELESQIAPRILVLDLEALISLSILPQPLEISAHDGRNAVR